MLLHNKSFQLFSSPYNKVEGSVPELLQFVVGLVSRSSQSPRDKYLLLVAQSSLMSIMMQTATLKRD